MPESTRPSAEGLDPGLAARIAALDPARRARLEQLVEDRLGAAGGIPPTPAAGPWRASFGQERLWTACRDEPAADNYAAGLRLRGPLNHCALRDAVHQVVRRHEVLRTRLHLDSDALAQHVDAEPRIPWRLVDLSHLADAGDSPASTGSWLCAPAPLLDDLINVEVRCPFDLALGPVLRVLVVRLRSDDHCVLFTIHHCATDGWSNGVLLSELADAYRDATQGVPWTAAPLPVQYRDFACWQRERMAGPEGARLSEFWRREVEDLPWSELPAKATRGAGPRRGLNLRTVLDDATRADLTHLREEGGGSLFMLVLAGLAAVLRELTGQDDLVLGTLSSGRSRPELERLVGYFVNVLMLRLRLPDSAQPFRELWRAVREQAQRAYAHQELPSERVLELARAQGWAGAASPIRVLCVLQEPTRPIRLPGLDAEPLDIDLANAPFDLVVELREQGAGLELSYQYDESLFAPDTMAVVAGQVKQVLRRVAADPGLPCAELLVAAGEPPVYEPAFAAQTVVKAVEGVAAAYPDAVAVTDSGRSTTYQALNARANRLARHLHTIGVRREDRVGIRLNQSADAITAMLAAVKAGAALVAFDPADPATRLAQLSDDAGITALITVSEYEPVRSVPTVLLDRDAAVIGAYGGGDLRLPVLGDQLAYLVYTSGSTGRPKAVMGTHRGLANRIRWMQDSHPVQPGEACALRTSPNFVDALWETFGPLAAGARLVVVPPGVSADPAALLDLLAAEQVERLVAVPGLLGLLLDGGLGKTRALPALRVCVTSGEELPRETARRTLEAVTHCTLLNLYGSSEVAADATCDRVSAPLGAVVPIGRAIAGLSVWVADERARPRPPLTVGEILVAGEGLARGYHRRPADTARVFRPNPYGPADSRLVRTGDLGRRLPGGALAYLGRRDAQVQIRGHRVEPGEVERAMLAHPAVRAAAVIALPDPAGTLALAAYFEPVAADAAVDPGALRSFLAALLPAYMVPAHLVPVLQLPRTSGGKLDRRALPPPRTRASTAGASSSGGLSAQVAAVFAEVLGLPEVGEDEDFFLIGGHSLLAARLIAELADRLGLCAGMADLFAEPTAAGLATRVGVTAGRLDGTRSALCPEPGALHDPFEMTEVQEAYYIGRGAQLRLGGVSTHAYVEVEIADLDLARFTAALRAVVARHPMLRAVIRPDGLQEVLAEVPDYQVHVTDLGQGEDPAAHLATVRAEMSHQQLDPHVWPLFDVRATLLGPAECGSRAVLHVSIDNLICDAYSFALVMDEIARRYRDPGYSPPELTATFRDYVRLRVAGQGSWRHQEALAYWRARLADLPTGPELPVTAAAGPTRFTRRLGRLAAAEWATFKARAADVGLTPSGALLAAFTETVTRWSRRPHYSLMLTVFDREPVHDDISRIVGDFTSLTVLEVDHRADPNAPRTFLERASALQRRLWSDLDHSCVGAVTVGREWAMARGLAPQPLSTVVFTSNLPVSGSPSAPALTPSEPARGEGLGELRYAITQTPQVHLDHQVGEQDGELLYNWDAVEDQFAPGVLKAMFEHYQGLLRALAADPDTWSKPPPGLLPPTQAARRAQVNATEAPLPTRCLHEAVAAVADRHPERLAVVAGRTRLTYARLVSLARRVGRTLRSSGTRPNTLVGVAAPGGWQQVVAALGVLESGAAFLPLDPALPPRRLDHLAERGAVELVLTTHALLGELAPPAGARLLAVDDLSGLDPDHSPLESAQGLEDLAYVVFTSGSGGEPKGVAIDHLGAANTVECVNLRFGVGPDDRVLAVSSLSFDLAIYDLFGLLSAGGAVVVPEHGRRRDPGHWLRLVRDERVTIWNSVPALAELLVERAEAVDPDALSTLRTVLLSGDWIPVALPDRIRALTGTRVTSLGGATEASIWSVAFPVDEVDPSWPSIPYGHPLANQTTHVLDDRLEPRPDWVTGELYIAGCGVARGYWGDPDLTEHSFPRTADGRRLYRTGDLARYLPSGDLEFLGREDSQVKINGYRIELAEIEAALERAPGVRAGAVVAVAEPGSGKRLVGCIVPADPASFDLKGVRARLAAMLPDYMVPAAWRLVDALPLTANGKVDRAALRDAWDSGPVPDADTAGDPAEELGSEPAAELVARITGLWSEVLGVGGLGLDDGFFALGGTSLAAIRMLARVEREFGVAVPLPELFLATTAAGFARVVQRALSGGESAPPAVVSVAAPDPARVGEPFPLTDVQQAYWLGRTSDGGLGGVATHSYLELEVDDLDPDRLERAVRGLIDRHDALRTIVRPDGQQQVLESTPRYRIPMDDLRGLADERIEAERMALRERMSHEVRDVGRFPLFEIRAQRVDETVTRLHLSFDLLTVDARSMRILTDELLARYTGCTPGPRPRLGFRDYVLAVERLREGARYRRDLDYWTSRLDTLPPAPDLPLAADLWDLHGAAFERRTTGLRVQDWQAVRAWGAARGLTPSSLVCAAFSSVLAQYSGHQDFTLNLTTFNRIPVHPDVEALVGDFTATTLLAVHHSGGELTQAARSIQEQIWRDLEHRLVSGVEVLRMLRRDPRRRAGAAMPIVFTSTLFSEDETEGVGATESPHGAVARAGWSARPVYAVSQTPQVLLDHQATEDRGRLVCTWDHVPDAFPPGFVDSMFEAFERALSALAAAALVSATATLEVSL